MTLWAAVHADRSLVFTGHDTGVQVEATFASAEYEYGFSVSPAHIAKVCRAIGLEWAGKEDAAQTLREIKEQLTNQKSPPNVVAWLEKNAVPHQFVAYHG